MDSKIKPITTKVLTELNGFHLHGCTAAFRVDNSDVLIGLFPVKEKIMIMAWDSSLRIGIEDKVNLIYRGDDWGIACHLVTSYMCLRTD